MEDKIVISDTKPGQIIETLKEAGIQLPVAETEFIGLKMNLETRKRSIMRCGAKKFDDFIVSLEPNEMLLCIFALIAGKTTMDFDDIFDTRLFFQ